MHPRTLARKLLVRSGLFLLALAVVAVLGGIVVGPAAATSQDMGARQALLPPSAATASPQLPLLLTQATQADPASEHPPVIPEPVVERLELEPAEAWILPGGSQDYTAEGFAEGDKPLGDVTAKTEVTITSPGRCTSDGLGKVSCTAVQVGDYGVTTTLTQEGRPDLYAKAVLHVDPVVSLALKPAEATIPVRTDQPYTAEGTTAAGRTVDVTDQSVFTITEPGKCSQAAATASCTASEVGDYTVTATLDQPNRDQLRATATLHVVPGPPERLELDPAKAEIQAGDKQPYTAVTVDQHNNKTDVTAQTDFRINKGGSCDGASCSATKVDLYTVTGTLRDHRPPLSGTATLIVVPGPTTSTTTTTTTSTTTTTTTPPTTTPPTTAPPTTAPRTTTAPTTTSRPPTAQPVISSVQPGFTFAGMSVEVGGNTGSCSRAGILTFHGNTGDASVNISADRQGNFVARVTIPKGTFPRAYKLELTADCNGQLQRAQGDLSVVNIAPTAANDSARTIQDTPVSIPVTDNDRNPDPDTGYPMRVLESSPPTHGTAEVLPDKRIRYTPEKGFIGQDQFQYGFCDDIINAAGQADCGTATVTVTVTDANACLPSSGNISSIKVDPSKSPGGKTLSITATVDRKLAACPFRLLLGGTPLPPDVPAGPDGSIAAERGVPKDAKPGPSVMRLTTMGAQTVAETPFEVVPPGLSLLLKLVIGAGAFVAGALARIALRRWRTSQDQRRRRRLSELPDDIRAEPHTRPVEVTVEPEHDNTRTVIVRLEPHPDTGTQTLQEMNP